MATHEVIPVYLVWIANAATKPASRVRPQEFCSTDRMAMARAVNPSASAGTSSMKLKPGSVVGESTQSQISGTRRDGATHAARESTARQGPGRRGVARI